MSRRAFIVSGIAVLAVLLAMTVVACSGTKQEGTTGGGAKTATPVPLDGKALASERCAKCHNLQRVEAAKKSADEWKTTVERMVGKGAQLNEAEQKAVMDYLAKAYPK